MITRSVMVLLSFSVTTWAAVYAQETATHHWIRPADARSEAVWGIENGIVFSLWPYGLENREQQPYGGGPRGLIRIGYQHENVTYLVNFLAIEPVVNGKIEFSEISPSAVDGAWGKLLWAGDRPERGYYYPTAQTPGIISKVGDGDNEAEELSVYIFMERFASGAAPYLKLSVRSDRPEELCIQIFHHEDSTPMDRCTITATMGNYSRLRNLHLKSGVVKSTQLYAGFDGIDFVEKESYPMDRMLEDTDGYLWALATGDEPMDNLAAWPNDSLARAKMNWKYRPPFKFTQYWKREKLAADPSLVVRVNGRARYWSGGSRDTSRYMRIPGGPSFENFELREKYSPGQRFYYGLSRKSPEALVE